jgi:ribose transport system permease protein
MSDVRPAFGSLMLTARTGSGEPNLGGNLMLESLSAAVIGGVSLQAGVGLIIPAIRGSIFVTMLSNAMDLLEVGGYVQQILPGCVIIGAIFLDTRARDPLTLWSVSRVQ